MKKTKKKINRYTISGYIHFIIFIIATIALKYIWMYDYNTWLNDPNKAEIDPIRQIIYPLVFMPFLAFIYGIAEGGKKYRFIIPIISLIVAFIFYIVAEDSNGEILLSDIGIAVPSLITSLLGIGVLRIIRSIIRVIRKKY